MLIDANIYISKGYLQVDGTKHTGTFRGKKAIATIKTDTACCLVAWKLGAKLRRLHHDDAVDSAYLLDALECVKAQHCIVLSPSFSKLKWKKPNGVWQTYLKCLRDRLPGCDISEISCGNYIFTHRSSIAAELLTRLCKQVLCFLPGRDGSEKKSSMTAAQLIRKLSIQAMTAAGGPRGQNGQYGAFYLHTVVENSKHRKSL